MRRTSVAPQNPSLRHDLNSKRLLTIHRAVRLWNGGSHTYKGEVVEFFVASAGLFPVTFNSDHNSGTSMPCSETIHRIIAVSKMKWGNKPKCGRMKRPLKQLPRGEIPVNAYGPSARPGRILIRRSTRNAR